MQEESVAVLTCAPMEIFDDPILIKSLHNEETPLDTQSIIAELEAERDRLNRAIEALQGSRGRHGRPAGKTNGGKRHLSAAVRKRIGEAMRKRWADRKKKAA